MAHITGDDASNLLLGDGSPDLIEGLGGNDALLGGGGNDTLIGGAGEDNLNGGLGGDLVDYGGSTAVLIDLGKNSAAGGEAFGDSFTSIEGVLGSNEGDVIAGDGNSNSLIGRGGNDLLKGGGGSDFLSGDDGNDTLNGEDGDDVLTGGLGADKFDGGNGLDGVFYAGSAAGVNVDLAAHTASGGDAEGDTFTSIEALGGSDFNDRLTGDAQANFIEGEGGFDRLNGGGGNDRVQGTGILTGGGGNDTVFGGDALANAINGNGGGDLLAGGELNDTISAGDGNDIINGYLGADQLRGGIGADKFQYFSFDESAGGAATQDIIFDFSRAQHDRIDVELVFDDINTQPDEAFHFLGTAGFTGHAGELRFVEVDNRNQTFVQADIDGDKSVDLQIKLVGLIALTAADFIL